MFRKYCLLFLLLLALSPYIKANHINGADLTYKCLGNNKYQFFLTVYRDCSVDGEFKDNDVIVLRSKTCHDSVNVVVTKLGAEIDVSPICVGTPSTCDKGTGFGEKKQVYTGIQTIPQCADWLITWGICARSEKITTTQVADPGQECLYIESFLNNLAAPCNNSPTFTANPVIFSCVNDSQILSPGTLEDDKDSLVYSLVTPNKNVTFGGALVPIKYKSPYTAQIPLTTNGGAAGFILDPKTGTLTINAKIVGERTITDLLVQEYRKGVLIGSVTRDLQIITTDCNNKLPTLSGISGVSGIDSTSTYSLEGCAGTKICFQIYGKDTDALQNTTMTLVGVPSKATVSTTPPNTTAPRTSRTLNFCWTPAVTDIGQNSFDVIFSDNACPNGVTQRSYTITVLSPPVPIHRTDTTIACGVTIPLTANIKTGTGKTPFSYLWNTGETTSKIDAGIGKYFIDITDAKGCKGTDTINLLGGLTAAFKIDSLCVNSSKTFKDLSVSKFGNVNSWTWDFGDGITSTEQNPKHAYTGDQLYTIKLTVGDDKGCIVSAIKKVQVCDIPTADFAFLDSCQIKLLPIKDLSTSTSCPITKRVYFEEVHGKKGGPFNISLTKPVLNPVDTGTYTYTYIVYNKNGCTDTIVKKKFINPKPWVFIGQITPDTVKWASYTIKCNKPDTIFTAFGASKATSKTKPLRYIWNPSGETTKSIKVNQKGTYLVTVTDSIGCTRDTTLEVKYPVFAADSASTFCHFGDSIHFKNKTQSHWAISGLKWDFGDTTNSTLTNPVHLYKYPAIHTVKLIATDVTTCSDTTSLSVSTLLPDKNFVVSPDTVCFGTAVSYDGPNNPAGSTIIQYWRWAFDSSNPKDTLRVTDPKLKKGNKTYATSGLKTVKLTIGFNNKCDTTYTAKVFVRPALTVVPKVVGSCAGDTTYFNYVQTNGDSIVSLKWEIYDLSGSSPVLINTLSGKNPTIFFPKSTSTSVKTSKYQLNFTATDKFGCKSPITSLPFKIISLPAARILIENLLVNDTIDRCQNASINFDAQKREGQDHFFWNFGDQTPLDTFTFTGFRKHSFPGADTSYKVILTTFTTEGCIAGDTANIKVHPSAVGSFVYDTVCLHSITTLDASSSTFKGVKDPTLKYSWYYFPNNADSIYHSDPIAQHIFPHADSNLVGLQILSSNACVSTLLKNIYIKPGPIVRFKVDADTNNLTSNIIPFKDSSYAGLAGGNIINYSYDFGDGGTSNGVADPTHTYNARGTYTIIEKVTNSLNCSDTAHIIINLNAFLALPNAYKPNADDATDKNGKYDLVYKNIRDLHDFKIFNRWGQVVFDAKGDKKAYWDGTFNSAEQPLGVYVYYVNATSIFGDNIIIKGNVTLLR